MAIVSSAPLHVRFVAGAHGTWSIESNEAICGDGLPTAERLQVVEAQSAGTVASATEAAWTLRGVTSNARYTTQAETDLLRQQQPSLGRTEATCAAMIAIRKSPAWWAMAQDERRAILEEQSHHIAIGLEYLPAIARRLHHSRDLGEPFDFITWFEFAPANTATFAELLGRLRASAEWRYIDREVDLRLRRDGATD